MSSKIKYSNEPLGKVAVVEDFLPPPEKLAFREETVKVTITLNKASIEFFKREAKRHGTPYQAMIRRLLDAYAQRYTLTPDSVGRSHRGK
ncbi:MAG TPA: CopG family transcriptional regulator [Gammaproteobacteria bacterium]|nr:CopG family transcriptional regulator [Gammaproteobacteria bacterium]